MDDSGNVLQIIRSYLSKGIMGIGIGIVSLLAIPTGILFLTICGVWKLTGWFISALDGRK